MSPEVFVEKIEDLVSEFTKDLTPDEEIRDKNGNRIIYRKTEIEKAINIPYYQLHNDPRSIEIDLPSEIYNGSPNGYTQYKTTHCQCCGKKIYYNCKFTPTHCSNCN